MSDRQEREDRERAWADLHREASEAGMAAVNAKGNIPHGACGFAWVLIRPGNCSFARWAKKNVPLTDKAYHGGVSMWCPLNTQSMTVKEIYCDAYAAVLKARGVTAYSQSRMD